MIKKQRFILMKLTFKSFYKVHNFQRIITENSPIFVLLSSVKCAPDFNALPKSFINDRI